MKNIAINPFTDTTINLLYAGLRRSVYGLREKNSDNQWWSSSARTFATSIKERYKIDGDVEPVIIQIVSGYSGDGTTVMGFKKPDGLKVIDKNISFNPNTGINHEEALSTYDKDGVKVILQFESGNSDILECLDIVNRVFGHHKCIIGYGIDAEWYFTKESNDATGLPITDNCAAEWLDKVLSFNSKYLLFLKHWEPSHMPPTFKNSNLWFLSDSQMFSSLDEMVNDFSSWELAYDGAVTGYQFGYPDDKKWWALLENPTLTISQRILKDLKTTKFLFWVDFTAGQVEFR